MKKGIVKRRIIKCIPIFMILVFGFVMRCELFHMKLGDELEAHYLSSSCMISEGEFKSFKNNLIDVGEKNGSSIGFTIFKNNSKLEHSLNIYLTNEADAELINKEYGIKDGVYQSFMNGNTNVNVMSIEEMTYEELQAAPWIVFIADETTAKSIYAELSASYDVSYPRMMQGEETDMIVIISTLVIIVMIAINALSVFRSRKETIIREVYGEDIIGLTIKAIIADMVTFEALYFTAKSVVSLFSSGEYKPGLSFMLFQIGCVAAALLNLLYLKTDRKAVFSNVTHSTVVYKLLYVLKAVAFFVATFTLATNLSNLAGQTLSKGSKELYASYKDASFAYFYDRNLINTEDMSDDEKKDGWSELIKTHYDELKPVVDIMLVSGNPSVLVMNDYAKKLLPESLQTETNENTDIVVLCKTGNEMSEKDIEGLIGLYFEDTSNVSYDMRLYEKNVSIPYVSSGTLSAFANAYNPTVFYINNFENIRTDMLKDNQDIFFDISEKDLKQFLESSEIGVNGDEISTTNFGDYYVYKMSIIARILSFLSSLCVLIIVLEMLITSVVTRMEYKIFGMDYAVKKIMGYSFFEKNKNHFAKLVFPNVVGLLAVVAIGIFTNLYRPELGLITGIGLMIAEIIIALLKSLAMERTEIRKILKGGCL